MVSSTHIDATESRSSNSCGTAIPYSAVLSGFTDSLGWEQWVLVGTCTPSLLQDLPAIHGERCQMIEILYARCTRSSAPSGAGAAADGDLARVCRGRSLNERTFHTTCAKMGKPNYCVFGFQLLGSSTRKSGPLHLSLRFSLPLHTSARRKGLLQATFVVQHSHHASNRAPGPTRGAFLHSQL